MPPRTRVPRPDFLKDAETVDPVKPQAPRTLRPGNDGPKTQKTPPPTPPPSPGKYVETVEAFYARIAIGLMPFAPNTTAILTEELPVDPTKTGENAETEMRLTKCAKAWDKLAQKNPSVRRMLERMSTTSPAVEVIELNLPIIASLAGEMGFFRQAGNLLGKVFAKRTAPEPEPSTFYEYDAAGHPVNPEFGRTVA